MLKLAKEIKKTKRNSITLNTCQDQSKKRLKNCLSQKNSRHPSDSDSEIQTSDHCLSEFNQKEHNQVGDITENKDSVYSLQFMMDKDKKESIQVKNSERVKQIRYTVKREKCIKRRKDNNKNRSFSEEEDQRLLNFILKKGPKFHKFSRHFPGKTTNMLKNRYYKQLRFIWDHILGSQYHDLNYFTKEQPQHLAKVNHQLRIEDFEDIQLFPEAEDLLSNILDCLSKTFLNIHTYLLQEKC